MKPKILCLFLLFSMVFSIHSSAAASEPTPQPGPDPALQALHEAMQAGEPAPVLPGQAQMYEGPAAGAQPETTYYNPITNWSKIVFQSYRNNNWEIYLANGDTTNPVRLTTNSAIDTAPRLNRGTNHIVFASNRDGDYEIYTMNLDGSNLQKLTSNTAADTAPSWSPDSSRIAFESNRDGNYEIYVMNADGTNQVRVTNDPAYDDTPSWMTDGSQIIWARRATTSPYGDIVSANPDGSDVQVIKSGLALVLNPIVSPDGEGIAYNYDYDEDGWYEIGCSTFSGAAPLYTYCPNGPVETYQSNTADDMLGGWAPSNKGLVYSHQEYVYYKSNYYLTHAAIMTATNGGPTSFIDSGYDVDPDWTTSDTVPPTSSMGALPAFTNLRSYGQGSVSIANESDGDGSGSGIAIFQIQYRKGDNGPWTTLCTNVYQDDGHTCGIQVDNYGIDPYYYRSRVIDWAGNTEAWPVSPDYDAKTFYYSWEMDGSVADNRGQPIMGASGSASSPLVFQSPSSINGSISMLLFSYGYTDIDVQHPGYGVLPPVKIYSSPQNPYYSWFLPPIDNIIVNGDFEDPSITAWKVSGDQGSDPFPSGPGYSGVMGAMLRQQMPAITWSSIGPALPENDNSIALAADSQGTQFAIWASDSKIHYAHRLAGAGWSTPEDIAVGYAGRVAAAVGSDDTLTVAWAQVPPGGDAANLALYEVQKPLNGDWGSIKIISSSFTSSASFILKPPSLAADHQGGLHLAFSDSAGVWYAAYASQSGWTTPELIGANGINPELRVGQDDVIHLMWYNQADKNEVYAHQVIGGSLNQETVTSLPPYYNLTLFVVDTLGQVHAASANCYTVRSLAGAWSPCTQITKTTYAGQLLSMEIDSDNRIYVAWDPQDIDLYFPEIAMSISCSPGIWCFSRITNSGSVSYVPPQTPYWTDEDYKIHINPDGTADAVVLNRKNGYSTVNFADVTIPLAMDTSIQQTVTIPADMHNPTLSFIYRSDSKLEIKINGVIIPPTGLADIPGQDFHHAWVDMSPWAGQTVEIKFNLHGSCDQDTYNDSGYFIIDEVSLGRWEPQVIWNSFVPMIMK